MGRMRPYEKGPVTVPGKRSSTIPTNHTTPATARKAVEAMMCHLAAVSEASPSDHAA